MSNLSGRDSNSSNKDSETLRICGHCLNMLESRRRVQVEQMMQPTVCQLYSHLQKNKQQIQNSVEMYHKVSYILKWNN